MAEEAKRTYIANREMFIAVPFHGPFDKKRRSYREPTRERILEPQRALPSKPHHTPNLFISQIVCPCAFAGAKFEHLRNPQKGGVSSNDFDCITDGDRYRFQENGNGTSQKQVKNGVLRTAQKGGARKGALNYRIRMKNFGPL